MEPAARTPEQAVHRWVAGIGGTAAVAIAGLALQSFRDWDRQLVEVMSKAQALDHRIEEVEDALRTNRLTRMAPETRVEIEAIKRELQALSGRVEMLEQRGR